MWHRSARWSLFSSLLLVKIIFVASSTRIDSEKSDLSNTTGGKTEIPNPVQGEYSLPSRNQTNQIVFQWQHNSPNTKNSLNAAGPFNPYRLKKRWSEAYEKPGAGRRTFFSVLGAPRPHPNNGLPFKGYRPPRPSQVGYPVARPPLHTYQPQPNRPTQPPHTYGVPKPTGYPASSNYHQQEIYITYPPATTALYPQTTGNSNLGGYYGPVVTPGPAVTSTIAYRPPKPTVPLGPSKPIYEVPISYPNPSYPTNKPDYYIPSTTPNPYATPIPQYPLPLDQGVYPGYPVSSGGNSGGSYNPQPGSSYPSPSLGTTDSHKPHYPAPSVSYPSYPAPSGGSYHESAPVGSHLPVFVFIPKPGYFNVQSNSKPGNYHKPSGSYPVNYQPTPRPSGIPNGPNPQYYPVPVPVKPSKPTGVYLPAKAPSTAYGLPKPQRPTQQYQTSSYAGKTGNGIYLPNHNSALAATGYRNDNQFQVQSAINNDKGGSLTRQPSDSQVQENGYQLATSSISQSKPLQPAQPSVFQRGNVIQRPADSQATYSAVINDFIALPGADGPFFTNIGQPQSNIFNNQNKSGLINAESSHLVTVTELPNTIGNLPYYRDDFRVPFQSINKRPIQNDCGGSWVVLGQPTSEFVDPTQVQVEPIYPSAEEYFSSGFHSNFNGQFFRGPKGADESLETIPPRINELSIADPNTSNAYKPYVPDFLIFSTTPYPKLSTTTATAKRLWRRPNSLASPFSFHPSPLVSTDPITASEQRTSSSGITVIIPEFTDSVKTLTSTENSVILSLNAKNLHNDNNVDSDEIQPEQEKVKNWSPFLAAVSSAFNNENDDQEAENFVTSEATGNNLEIGVNSSVTEDTLIRHLRSANLRVLSSLISQAEIASLFQDKGTRLRGTIFYTNVIKSLYCIEYTLMAPSNAAFGKISAAQRRRWITRPDSLREVLLNHVIPSHLNSSSFENEATHITLAGSHHLRINIYNATETRVCQRLPQKGFYRY